MKKRKKISFILLSLVTILQVAVYEENFLSREIPAEEKETVAVENSRLDFEQVYGELSSIEGLSIINLENKDSCWQITVTINVDQNKIKDVLQSLAQYRIKKYNITGEKNLLLLSMEMVR